MRRSLLVVAVAALLAPLSIAAAAPDGGVAPPGEAKAIALYHTDRGFIDDAFAVSPNGKTLAYITTDGAASAQLHFAEVGAKGDAPVPYETINAYSLDFLDDKRVLAVDLDPATQLARARVYTAAGPGKERLGPATTITTATVAGTPAIITFLKQARGKGWSYTLTAYRRDTLKPIGQRRVLLEDPSGRVTIAGGAHKPLYFTDDHGVLVALREGAFDQAHDIRKPDVEVRVDVFSGKALREREIGDRMEHGRRVAERAKHDGQSVFVAWNEEVTELRLVDAADAVTPIALPRPAGKYEPNTLEVQVGAGDGPIYFSLTVDPVNAEAVAAKKADQDWIDLCALDPRSHAVTVIARVDGKKRGSRWRLAGGTLALLRKHKGFPRGGADLEILTLPR